MEIDRRNPDLKEFEDTKLEAGLEAPPPPIPTVPDNEIIETTHSQIDFTTRLAISIFNNGDTS